MLVSMLIGIGAAIVPFILVFALAAFPAWLPLGIWSLLLRAGSYAVYLSLIHSYEEQPGAAVAIAQLKGVVIVKGLNGIGKQSLSADKFVHWFCSVEMKEVGLYAKRCV